MEDQHRPSSAAAAAVEHLDFEFEDSRLGTKEYWDHFYDAEIANFEDTGDEGEIWFGRSAELRVLKFVLDRVSLSARICDLGTGNGSLIRKLRDRGYTNLCGLDYSPKAIELARRSSSPSRLVEQRSAQNSSGHPASDKSSVHGDVHIDFQVIDLTAEKLATTLQGRFDILLDKGTLDAISLSPDRQRRLQNYQRNICHLFRNRDDLDDEDFELHENKEMAAAALARRHQKRLLLIVSCNFTKDELVDLLETECLQFECELPATAGNIRFGGKTGTTCSGVIFKWIAGEEPLD